MTYDLERTERMIAQHNAEGFKSFTGSKYDTDAASLKGTMTEDKDPASNFTNFSAALNRAVSLARSQRQSTDLDMLNGQIKPGSVSASSFTSLLSDINTASNNFSQPLVKRATDFAAEELKAQEDRKNSINELAVRLAEKGAKKEVIQGILNAPDIESAIAMSAGALKDQNIRQVGSQLVTVDEATGKVQVIYSAPQTGGSTSGDAGTGFFKSGALKIDNSDVGEGAKKLSEQRGDDGFTNTDLYVQMYNHWTSSGGLPQDFFKQYDPDFYVNPADTSVPSFIKSSMSKQEEKDDNPFN